MQINSVPVVVAPWVTSRRVMPTIVVGVGVDVPVAVDVVYVVNHCAMGVRPVIVSDDREFRAMPMLGPPVEVVAAIGLWKFRVHP